MYQPTSVSRSRMRKTILISLICLVSIISAAGQETAKYESAEALQREVTFLLLGKNINEVINDLESEPPTSVASLLRRLVIYGRAGRASRIRATLEQLPTMPNWRCSERWDLRGLVRRASEVDLASQRFYYDRLCPDDIEGAEEFVRSWTSRGDLKELDAWLGERSNRNDEWLMLRVQLRSTSGNANEILDALAADIKANPSDWKRIERYLRANNRAANAGQDPSWLADAFQLNSAAHTFQLGDRLRDYSPQAAAKLFLKSLDLPFTDADAKLVDEMINRGRSVGISKKINWEKQMRYWTKRGLAAAYQRMHQPLAAQPLVEELTAIKGDDILLEDVHSLAGTVQAQSGHRVVETKILQDENARRLTSEYWIERANYYDGREEYDRERDSFREALVALAAKPDDMKALGARYEVVRMFAFFLEKKHHGDEDHRELEKLLAVELKSTPPETIYTFWIAKLMLIGHFELASLRNSLLAKPDFCARLLDGRGDWSGDEARLIEDVAGGEGVPSAQRDALWTSLEQLVRDPGSHRAYELASAMNNSQEWQRAIPLWRGYMEHAPANEWENYKSIAVSKLLTGYCRTKQCKGAEKLLLTQGESYWRELPNALAEVAIAAAQQDAVDDAIRLWQMSSNLDRRNLDALPQLAQTKAKPQLLAMYSKMKQDDPTSIVPELALKILQ